MGSTPEAFRPHVVCIPYPLQGHINPMLKLAKLLHHKGFYITFVNTEYNHKRLLRSRGPNSLDGLLDFHFEIIPDGLPPSDTDVSQDIPSLSVSISKNGLLPLCNLISKLNNTSSWDRPPVTSIISDGCMSFTLDAAEKLGIPNVLFWTPSSCGFLGYMHYRHLVERGLTPLKGDSVILPPEFVTETKNRAMLATWCAQEKILKHPSIGGFITHSGWNSTLESVCGGVPMISWPFFAEQYTNCRYSCTEWGIGMEIDNNVQRDVVEKLVRELMNGERGKEMKKNVIELKTKADEATKPGGSSYKNMEKLIAEVLQV